MKKIEELKKLRSKNAKELSKDISESYDKLTELKFSRAFRNLKNTKSISATKKHISRAWTVLDEKLRDNENK